ncbi:hypothetical protein ABG768_018815 [Culter alburnus]|uniref:DNA/RNA non-specific endonuclease domain-containing protein n=1 Tax=Culter alburnus TaxID=194366 RepID=A0AAW2AW76_CULAL
MFTLHPTESEGNGKTTLEKGGKNPPDVTLAHIVEDLLRFFNGFECLHEAKQEIEQKYDIKKQHGHYCWSADDIKRAWGKTQRMNKKSSRRKDWARVIMVQMIKIYICDECKQNAAQEESRIASESQLTWSNTEAAPSPAEVNSTANSSNSKTKDVVLENENKDTSDNNCEQRKNEADSSGNKGEGTNHGANKESVSNTNQSDPQTVYIRIPLSVMTGNASECMPVRVQNGSPIYKLIDRVPDLTELRKKKSYAFLYDNRTRNAAWVYEILNKSTLEKRYKPKNQNRPYFKEDKSIHPFYQAPESRTLYFHSRGHLATAANHRWCQEAFEDTFLLSNMAPQHESLNSGIWENLETQCQDKIRTDQNKIRNIHVYSGPLYLPNNDTNVHYIMVNDKAVPTHFFKVVIEENMDDTVELKCYQMPNEEVQGDTKLENYEVELEFIERVSGLIFRESRCYHGEIDSVETVTWEGNGHVATSKIKISTPRTNSLCARSLIRRVSWP